MAIRTFLPTTNSTFSHDFTVEIDRPFGTQHFDLFDYWTFKTISSLRLFVKLIGVCVLGELILTRGFLVDLGIFFCITMIPPTLFVTIGDLPS